MKHKQKHAKRYTNVADIVYRHRIKLDGNERLKESKQFLKIQWPFIFVVKKHSVRRFATFHQGKTAKVNLGDKKNGGFLKQILSISIQEKLIKIGDG